MSFIIELVSGTIMVIIGICVSQLHKKMEEEKEQREIERKQRDIEQKALKCGIQALLRNGIIREYKRSLDKGYCPIYTMENAEAMYVEYRNLGGNGTITNLMLKLRDMPTEEV